MQTDITWKIVPTEPTPEMSAAGFSVSEGEHDPAAVYRAMVKAVPATPALASDEPWYSLSHTGIANLCASELDAQQESEASQTNYPKHGPYRAVQLVEASELERMRADRDTEKRLRKDSDDLATDLRLALESVMSRKGDTGLAWDVLQRIHGAHWSPA